MVKPHFRGEATLNMSVEHDEDHIASLQGTGDTDSCKFASNLGELQAELPRPPRMMEVHQKNQTEVVVGSTSVPNPPQ